MSTSESLNVGWPLALVEDSIWTARDEAARQELARLSADCENQPLARLALQVAVGEFPELIVDQILERLNEMARAVATTLLPDASDHDKIRALNAFLFDHLKFHGDESEYYDPRNSYLNEVLARRAGLPITLGVLYLDLAARLSLEISGIGLPGHFIVGYLGQPEMFVDPFHRTTLTRVECQDLVKRLSGGRLPWYDDYLRAVNQRYIMTRLLNNLKGAYARRGDSRRGLRIQNYLLTLHPEASHEIRDRGHILADLGSFRGALNDYRAYLEQVSNAPDRDVIEERIAGLEERIASLC